MKNFILITTLLLTTMFTGAQDSWKITLNSKIILSAREHNEALNTRKIKSSEWKKTGYLEINYKETPPSSWLHSLELTDESGNQIIIKDSTNSAKIPLATLRSLFVGKKGLKINMIISPSNPMMGAPSRIVHLCTFKLP